MRKPILVFWAVLAILAIVGGPAAAGDFSLNLGGTIVPFLNGDAGSGPDAPGYDDAFDAGLGASLEAAYRLNERFSLLAGFAYEKYAGGDYQGVSFDDLKILPVFVGGKFHFAAKDASFNPYLRADIGLARLGAVDISYLGASAAYWNRSWQLFGDFGAGVEYRFSAIGIFAEVKARYLDGPDDAFGYYSQADAAWSLPILIGISWHF